ncbi:hypothetical protein ACFPFX_19595 [Streptomyces mauvecolor]|uniref:Uncharacterized protein n=1 Tax=Streptomyces mauvecolor TaxID=58345 RepID=A0ABV9UQ08_9ACTN
MSARGPAEAASIPALDCGNRPGRHPPARAARHGRFEPYGEDVGDGGPGGF